MRNCHIFYSSCSRSHLMKLLLVLKPPRMQEDEVKKRSLPGDSPVPNANIGSFVYNGVDLLAGHCPNKPTLFATQRLSLIFTSKKLEENTINPKEKSGKRALDPDRIKLIFDALNAVYGEKKVQK